MEHPRGGIECLHVLSPCFMNPLRAAAIMPTFLAWTLRLKEGRSRRQKEWPAMPSPVTSKPPNFWENQSQSCLDESLKNLDQSNRNSRTCKFTRCNDSLTFGTS